MQHSGRIVKENRLTGFDETRGGVGDCALLRALTRGAVKIAGFNKARWRGGYDSARLAQEAATGEFVEVAMRSHQADAEAFDDVLDAHRAFGHDRLRHALTARHLPCLTVVARDRVQSRNAQGLLYRGSAVFGSHEFRLGCRPRFDWLDHPSSGSIKRNRA